MPRPICFNADGSLMVHDTTTSRRTVRLVGAYSW